MALTKHAPLSALDEGLVISSHSSVAAAPATNSGERRLGVRGATARVQLFDLLAIALVTMIVLLSLWRDGLLASFGIVAASSVALLIALNHSVKRAPIVWSVFELAWLRPLPAYLLAFACVSVAILSGAPGAEYAMYWAVGTVWTLAVMRMLIGLFVRRSNSGKGPERRVGVGSAHINEDVLVQAIGSKFGPNAALSVHDGASLYNGVLLGQFDEIVLCDQSREADLVELSVGNGTGIADIPVDVVIAHHTEGARGDGVADGWRLQTRRKITLNEGARFGKRLCDCGLAALLILITLPMMLVIAALIKASSPGPVLFRQERTGLFQQPFKIFKFRTLHDRHKDLLSLKQARLDDHRVTTVGRFLRATSLDELPQLFNVLLGDMSLVGPRPHAPMTCVSGQPFEELVANYAFRHCARPGITGLAQVNGSRGPVEDQAALERRLAFDLEYIANWSWRCDLIILLKTLGVPFSPVSSGQCNITTHSQQQVRQEG